MPPWDVGEEMGPSEGTKDAAEHQPETSRSTPTLFRFRRRWRRRPRWRAGSSCLERNREAVQRQIHKARNALYA